MEGFEGWGECVAGETPAYSCETTETAWHALTTFILPALIGSEPEGPDEILAPVAWIQGHAMAKATAEMAAWDLQAREQSVPLWDLLGGSDEGVPVALVVGLQSDETALLRRIEEGVDRGYALVKLKIKPGRDIATLRSVRRNFPDLRLAVDANGAYSTGDRALLESVDDFGLAFLEQPLAREDLTGHARLQAGLRTPICLDESITSKEQLELALELGACRMVSLKPGQVGGFGVARALHDHCLTSDIPVRCGGMLETGIGRAHTLALATLPGFTIPGDISESRRYWNRDLVDPEWELQAGRMVPHPGPGIGVQPDEDRIEELTVRRTGFGSLV